MELFAVTLLLLCGLLLRLLYSSGETSDQWVSLWHLRRQAQQARPSYAVPDSVIDGTYDYPVLFHWLLARVPERARLLAARLLNVVPDLAHALLLYLFLRVVTADVRLSLFGLAFFLTLPVLLPTTPRFRAIKARAFGTVPVTLFFLGLFLGLEAHPLWFLLAVFGVWLAAYSSLFAFQVTLFSGLLLSILLPSWWPLLVIGVSVTAGLLNPHLRPPIVFWWRHKRWYFRNIRERSPAANRSSLSLFALPYYLLRRPRDAGNLFFYDSPLLIALYSHPLLFFLLWTVFTQASLHALIIADPLLHFLWAVTLSSFVLFVLTMLPGLLIFGEAERYFEYTAPFFVALLVLLLTRRPLLSPGALGLALLWNCTVVLLLLVFLNHRRILFATPLQDEDELRSVAAFLHRQRGARVATLPVKLSYLLSTLLPQRGRAPAFYYRFITRAGDDSFRYFERDLSSFNTFSGTPAQLRDRYRLTHLVIDRAYIRTAAKTPFIRQALRLPRVHETPRYLVVALQEGKRCAA